MGSHTVVCFTSPTPNCVARNPNCSTNAGARTSVFGRVPQNRKSALYWRRSMEFTSNGEKRRPEKPSVATTRAVRKKGHLDPWKFLATIGEGRKFVLFPKKQTVFSQGDAADAVFYIQSGKARLTVVSSSGKEATIGILGEGEFFGEGSLAGQSLRMESATAMTDCAVLRIDRKAMMEALHREHDFSDMFVAYLLARNIRYEEDLVDQLFNSSEKRLARILLLLARFGKEGVPETVIPKISQETLAEMIGTTRSRVSFFMNRFRKLGFIEYNGEMHVHSSLLNVVLHDKPELQRDKN